MNSSNHRRRRSLRRVRRPVQRRDGRTAPTDPASDGPLSFERGAERLIGQISDAVDKGATLRTGGHRVDRPGAFVELTVLTDVTPKMRAYHEELFGPAAVICRVAGTSEAVELANSSSFGLGGVVDSADPAQAAEVADLLDTGMVWINSPQGSMADLPFGGTKRSGVGRELSPSHRIMAGYPTHRRESVGGHAGSWPPSDARLGHVIRYIC